jgi:hypothetical protein
MTLPITRGDELLEIHRIVHQMDDLEEQTTDTLTVARVRSITADWLRLGRDEVARSQNPPIDRELLRRAVRTAWLTGVENFRESYDSAICTALNITHFQDLWARPAVASKNAPTPTPSDDAITLLANEHYDQTEHGVRFNPLSFARALLSETDTAISDR